MTIAFYLLLSLVITAIFGVWTFIKGYVRGYNIGFQVAVVDTCTAVNKAFADKTQGAPKCPPTLN